MNTVFEAELHSSGMIHLQIFSHECNHGMLHELRTNEVNRIELHGEVHARNYDQLLREESAQ